MTPAYTAVRDRRSGVPAPAARRPDNCSQRGRLTLEQRLAGVWEGLTAAGVAACPLCGAEMRGEPGGAAGRCDGCGSRLS